MKNRSLSHLNNQQADQKIYLNNDVKNETNKSIKFNLKYSNSESKLKNPKIQL